MPAPRSDLLQGTLDLLILNALTLQELHRMGVSHRSLAEHSTTSTRSRLRFDPSGLEPHRGAHAVDQHRMLSPYSQTIEGTKSCRKGHRQGGRESDPGAWEYLSSAAGSSPARC